MDPKNAGTKGGNATGAAGAANKGKAPGALGAASDDAKMITKSKSDIDVLTIDFN